MGRWRSKNYHFTVSSNSSDGIYYARLYWVSTGIASICLLVIFCYFGWWYQRHWRGEFIKVVEKVLELKPKLKDDATPTPSGVVKEVEENPTPSPKAVEEKTTPSPKEVEVDSKPSPAEVK